MSQVATIQPTQNFTPDELKMITDVIAPKATPKELQLFLHRCKIMGLNPLKPGQIHFVKYGSGPGTIVVGIEGFRSIAARTGKLSGVERGVNRTDKGAVISGWAKVYRSDWKHPAHEEVPFAEYNTGNGPWVKMPETMIKKVAEAAALRMAFPDDLGGIYTDEEMDQASNGRVAPEQPGADDGDSTDGVWKFTFGKFNNKTVEEVYNDPRNGPKALMSYIEYLEGSAQKTGKALSPTAQEAIRQIEQFLGAMENAPLEPGVEE